MSLINFGLNNINMIVYIAIYIFLGIIAVIAIVKVIFAMPKSFVQYLKDNFL